MISVIINGVEMSPEQVTTLRRAVMIGVDAATEAGDEEGRERFLAMLHVLRRQSPEAEYRVGADRGPAFPVRPGWKPEP